MRVAASTASSNGNTNIFKRNLIIHMSNLLNLSFALSLFPTILKCKDVSMNLLSCSFDRCKLFKDCPHAFPDIFKPSLQIFDIRYADDAKTVRFLGVLVEIIGAHTNQIYHLSEIFGIYSHAVSVE